MITLSGWSQKWTVYKQNNDTIISYNFTKDELKNFRIYVTDLEKYKELYRAEQIKSINKDSLLFIKDLRISIKDSLIAKTNKFIDEQNSELLKTKKLNKELEDKYNKSKKLHPYFLGGGLITGLIIGLILR